VALTERERDRYGAQGGGPRRVVAKREVERKVESHDRRPYEPQRSGGRPGPRPVENVQEIAQV
jgi:hypothetical protein